MAMNRIEIEVLSSPAALDAFARARRQTRARRKATPRLAFGSFAELFSAVSEKRLELVRHVAGDEGLQIRPLARAVRRNRDSCRPAQGRLRAPGLSG
jgi:predicted transcriptional regulator